MTTEELEKMLKEMDEDYLWAKKISKFKFLCILLIYFNTNTK